MSTTDRLQNLLVTASANGSLQTTPEQKTITYVSGQAASSGDNSLIAAPASGVRIVLVYVSIQNATAVSTLSKLSDGASGAIIEQVTLLTAGYGRDRVYPPDARPKLTAATALILNLSGANAHNYTIGYYTE